MTQQPRVPDDWYEHFFTAPVNRFWEKMVPGPVTAADIAFILRHIERHPAARILDLPCGAGRHALALAGLGYDVVGVDISDDAIVRAASVARERALPARFVRADMRRFAGIGRFEAAICFGNSIGYFDAAGTAAFLARLAAALVSGARLILDSSVCAESILPIAAHREIAFEGGSYRSALSYDCRRSVLETQAELELDGQTHALAYAHHVVTSGALVAMLSDAGFEVHGMFADTDDTPFAIGSPRLLLVAQRR